MAGGGVPIPAGRIETGHRLLETQQQRLVTGVHGGRSELRRVLRGDAARAHELKRFGNAVRQLLVAMALRGILHKAQVPLMNALEICITAHRESADQIEGGCCLPVSLELPVWVGDAGCRCELRAVDDIAAIARQLDVALLLGRRRTRLGELAGKTADLYHRRTASVGQDYGHLQKDAEEVADVVGPVFEKTFRAISPLQQECVAGCDFPEALLQLTGLAGKNERREPGELALP